MFLLANSFALGSLAGGAVVTLLSCFLIRDAEAWFLLVWVGYAVLGCLSAALYAPLLKVVAFGRREVTSADGRRAFITAAVCALGEYLFAVAARTHQYDRVLLFTVPLCAALLDAVRARCGSKAAVPAGD
jgi:hypothetical protein